MKNAIKSIAFILIFVIMLNLLTISFFPKGSISRFGIVNTYKYEILGEEDDIIDVLVLGDSLVYSSYSPMEVWHAYGITSFDCAEPAQVVQGACKYLEVALEKEHPKIVIMEPNVIFRDIKKRKLKNTFATDMPRLFPIKRYHDLWKSYALGDDVGIANVNKGYTSITRINPSKPKKYMKPSDKQERIPDGNLDYLEKIIKMCDDYGAKLMFVSFPTQTSWNTKKHNSAEKVAQDYNIEFLDLNLCDLGIDWVNETRDGGQHLNDVGARKVSLYVGEYLKKTGLVSDHRNDEKYASWDAAYDKYVYNMKKTPAPKKDGEK